MFDLYLLLIVCAWVAMATGLYVVAGLKWRLPKTKLGGVLAAGLLSPGYFGLDAIAPVPAGLGLVLWCMEGSWPMVEIAVHLGSWAVIYMIFVGVDWIVRE